MIFFYIFALSIFLISLLRQLLKTKRVAKYKREEYQNLKSLQISYDDVFWEILTDSPQNEIPHKSRNQIYDKSKNKFSESNNKEEKIIAYGSIFGEATWFGAEAINNYFAINDSVFDALSHLAGHQLNTIGDLNMHLDHWDKDWLGNLTALNNLQGHVAEFTVAEHLRSAGHDVSFPENSNQVGYDLLVDGHPFNVKNVVDMSSIGKHFNKYPDIGVISNNDIDGLNPDNVLNFDPTHGIDQLELALGEKSHLIDFDLNHDVIVDQTDAAADAITGNIDFHIPFITLALSTYREAKILFRSETDIYNSAKNISLDTLGTGGGGFLGAKVGASIGTMITPGIGTVLGTVIGGVLGGIAGRVATNTIKEEPFKNSLNNYNEAKSTLTNKIHEVDDYMSKEYRAEVEHQILVLKSMVEEFTKKTKNLNLRYKNEFQNKFGLSIISATKYFQNATRYFDNLLYNIENGLSKIRFMEKFLLKEEYLILVAKKNVFKILKKEIQQNEYILLKSNLSAIERANSTFNVLLKYGLFKNEIEKHLLETKELIKKNKELLENEISKSKEILSEQRIKSYHSIINVVNKLKVEAEKMLEPYIQTAKSKYSIAVIEQKKLGL